MKIIDANSSEKFSKLAAISWSELKLNPKFKKIVEVINPYSEPRPVQALAFGKNSVLENRRNLIVSAPTNSGKSLVTTLLLLDAILQGKRAVLLEPLRVLAREKYEEFNQILPEIEKILKRKISVRITTGDYRLDGEYFYSPPPDTGEIIIATPERLDAIMRNPEHDVWVRSVGLVCLDEAHLLSSSKRGPTFEYLLTSFLCLPSPPRLILTSASLGSTEKARKWLAPCDEIKITERYPALKKQVLELTDDEDTNEVVQNLATDILSDPATSLLIFVYQTKSAEKLASALNKAGADLSDSKGVLAFHSQMSSQVREGIRQSFIKGESRCLIATTALSLGVNLPCTHVIIRDCTFPGVGPLSVPEILQMIGRAGRGNNPGFATVIVRSFDKQNAEELAKELKTELLPELRSSFELSVYRSGYNITKQEQTLPVATQTAVQIARKREKGITLDELYRFFEQSFGGKDLTSQVPAALEWLTNPAIALVYLDERKKYRVTKLCAKALESTLPLDVAAGYSQLLKDIMYLDNQELLLSNWQPLDHLIILNILSPQSFRLRPFSKKLVEQVDRWMEKASSSLLYTNWIRGEKGFSRSVELMGSLNSCMISSLKRDTDIAETAYKHAYLSTFHAIILSERSEGAKLDEVRRKWDVDKLEGIEERWRDTNLWLLSGLLEILDLTCFYYHLKEECNADRERIKKVKISLLNMRQQVFKLLEKLKYCSPLGGFLFDLRQYYRNKGRIAVGHQTIQRLETAGITNLRDLTNLREQDLIELGIRRNAARKINDYIIQRLRF
jgi:superfamily II DNA/RNA helicase